MINILGFGDNLGIVYEVKNWKFGYVLKIYIIFNYLMAK